MLDPSRLDPAALAVAGAAATGIGALGYRAWRARPRDRIQIVQLDRITYGLLIRSTPRELRYRNGRVVVYGTGSYGVAQADRTCDALISYDVLDEAQLVGLFDGDSQVARLTFASLPPHVGGVALYPITERVSTKHALQQASSTGFGLGHKSMAEVDHLGHIWRPPLRDFNEQLSLQLQHAGLPSPALIVADLSCGGHALPGLEATAGLRQIYPYDSHTILLGVAVVPSDPEQKRQFADFLERLVTSNHLDYLLLTANRQGPDAQHDDLVAHLVGIILQAARSGGANLANVFADATIPETSRCSASGDGQPRRPGDPPHRTRILTFEFLEERVAVDPPPHLGLIRRLFGTRPGVPRTSPRVLVERGEQLASALAAGKGQLAGLLSLASDTRTALLLGLPSNAPSRFPEIAAALRTHFEARQLGDPNRVHFAIGRLSVPQTPMDKGAPLVGIRLGEMQGSLSEILTFLRMPIGQRPPAAAV